MLSYEPDDRPSAAQLVETMEVLAQDGADMGIRRFCRTLVAEAKTALPDLDTGDPLAGQIVDEDASASFAPSTAPGASNPGMASSPATLGGPAAGSAAKRTSTPAPSQIKIQGPAVAEPPDAGGGNGMWIGLGIVAVLAMLGLGGLAIVGTGAAIFVSSEGVPYSEPEPEPAPEPTKPPPNVGGNVISDDRRDDAKRAATTLKYDGAGGAQIIISNRTGFKAEWDGKEDFAVGKMAEGRYSTTIEKPGGKKVRGKSFSIEAGKSDCVWTFDAGSDAWAGGCR
jgi:hypothetical protein